LWFLFPRSRRWSRFTEEIAGESDDDERALLGCVGLKDVELLGFIQVDLEGVTLAVVDG
jgi:hypothetical protein